MTDIRALTDDLPLVEIRIAIICYLQKRGLDRSEIASRCAAAVVAITKEVE